MQSSSSYEEHHSGLMAGGGLSVSIGGSKLATTDQTSNVTNNASTVGSLNGNLSIQAGNTLHVTGSDLVAGQNLTGTAANVIVDAATDAAHQAHTERTSKSGLTIGLSGSIGDAINAAISETQAARNSSSGNDRAAALHAMAAAGDAALAGMGAYKLMNGATGAQAPSIRIQLSVGSSHSSSQSTEDQAMQRGSSIQAGGHSDVRRDRQRHARRRQHHGRRFGCECEGCAARRKEPGDPRQHDEHGRDAEFEFVVGGELRGVDRHERHRRVGVSASMQRAHGDGNSNAAMQNNTHVKGADNVTIVSGGDTNITGSDVKGGTVTANVGGNLNVASVQDTTVSTAHQSSMSAGFSISETGGQRELQRAERACGRELCRRERAGGHRGGIGRLRRQCEGQHRPEGRIYRRYGRCVEEQPDDRDADVRRHRGSLTLQRGQQRDQRGCRCRLHGQGGRSWLGERFGRCGADDLAGCQWRSGRHG